jgi:predicted Zn-dependent peptidase
VLFVAGDIEPMRLMDVLANCLQRVPDNPLSPRRRPAEYGPLPAWQAGETTEIQAPHADSVAYLLFSVPPRSAGIDTYLQWDFIEELFSSGELGSPLNRLVREHAQLAYSPEFISTTHPDGGYAGLVAQTSADPDRVIEAFWQLIQGAEIRSADWLDYVRDTIRGTIEMHDPDAAQYCEEGTSSLIDYGRCISDLEYSSAMLSYTAGQVAAWLEQLDPSSAHTIIFRGDDS